MAILHTNHERTTHSFWNFVTERLPELEKTPPIRNCLLTYQTFEWLKEKASLDSNSQLGKRVDELFEKYKWKNTVLEEGKKADFLQMYSSSLPDKVGTWPDETHPFSNSLFYSHNFDFRNLEITLPFETIKDIFDRTKALQLRPIDPAAKTLIIGCGNGRFCCGGQSALIFKHAAHPFVTGNFSEYECNYSLKHLHPDAVTIDPQLASNPTIVAAFGDQPVSEVFPKQIQLENIIFEGYFTPCPQPFRGRDICRLHFEDKQESTQLLLDEGHGPHPLSEQDRSLIEHDIDAYQQQFIS